MPNTKKQRNAIGVFDSGIGGLTVVKKLREYLPNESIIYFGDTARVPYGNKSNSTVIDYSVQNTKFLLKKNVKIIVVACNTASSIAIPYLSDISDVPVIGMIEPGTRLALQNTRNNKIGVIGTTSTISNKAYTKRLQELNNNIIVSEKACPLFVPLAEEGWIDHEATRLIALEYLRELAGKDIDTLILGCTHYPILSEVIENVMGEGVKLIDSGEAAAIEVNKQLNELNLKNDSNTKAACHFFVSDFPAKFKEIAERFMGQPLDEIEKISLEALINS